ncbi:hypothetical protein TcasGA2_TC033969 [Tribolium castaneum]|uniref:Ricin B lectin domain-containing protein n=1 Tax=Tribolium castaneum TaxID=7070 RepID=A0A139WDT6_TRICA|nr:PREDICTED: uncharacterized protein LOC103313787 [Tribolium castaneum]KYB26100.1 hypothetical protein TcasGA2_TC033969 [Tribolium castaneum]|eukprot:XP_008196174.2 PREDICTED: uncharacterized protein LOC103313787 [Tribolium castaneum]
MNSNCVVLLFFGVAVIASNSVAIEQPKAESSLKNAVQPISKPEPREEAKPKSADQPKSDAKNAVQANKTKIVTTDALGPINTIQPRMECSPHNGHYFMIKNPQTGLVLNACEKDIKLERPAKTQSQMWTLQMAGFGKFYFVNRATGNVLDIQGGGRAGARLITYPKHCGPNQQWYIHNCGQIASVIKDLVVGIEVIRGGNLCGSRALIATSRRGSQNQVFEFVPV